MRPRADSSHVVRRSICRKLSFGGHQAAIALQLIYLLCLKYGSPPTGS
jgi:hypothetical protein